jgi:hypothetical protein
MSFLVKDKKYHSIAMIIELLGLTYIDYNYAIVSNNKIIQSIAFAGGYTGYMYLSKGMNDEILEKYLGVIQRGDQLSHNIDKQNSYSDSSLLKQCHEIDYTSHKKMRVVPLNSHKMYLL